MNQNNYYVKEKAEFYFAEKASVHLTLWSGKKDLGGVPLQKWANGRIDRVDEGSFVLDEERLGKVIVFFNEVIEIEPRRKKEDEKDYQESQAKMMEAEATSMKGNYGPRHGEGIMYEEKGVGDDNAI